VAAYGERPLSSEQTSLANIADWVRPKNGATWSLRRGELWLAGTPGGDRPVPVLTRDPVADRIGALVVADLTRTRHGLSSELEPTVDQDHVPSDCVVNSTTCIPCRATLFARGSPDCHQRAFMRRVARYEPAPDAECDLAEPQESAPQITDR
jgi:mRNA interferase MazF